MRCLASDRFVHPCRARSRRGCRARVPPAFFDTLARGLAFTALWTVVTIAVAQDRSQTAPLSIGTVLADTNDDFIPDHLGDTVTVAGRAVTASGMLRGERLDVFIQNGIGGIRLVAPAAEPPVALGDSVVATGVVEHVAGLAHLAVTAYWVVPGAPRLPEPLVLDLETTSFEAYEGQLARVEGYVAGKGRARTGRYLNLAAGDSMIVAFVFASNGAGVSFDDVHISDYVTITGIIGQYDLVAPHNTSYQIYPRYPRDVRLAGIPSRYYRDLVIGGSLLLLAALAWVYALRRQVRRRVAESRAIETRYQALFHNAGDALLVHDLRRGSSSPIHEANTVACALLGYTPEEMASLPLNALVAPRSHETLARHLQALRSEEQVVVELVLKTRQGRDIPFEISSHVFTMDGRLTVLSVARDVTQRKKYEQNLIDAKQEAEMLAQLKSSFLANMSHEIRTPLTSILGFADILTEDEEGTARELAQLIVRSSRRLMDTINSILDLSRLDANQVSMTPEEIDVVHEVRATVHLLDTLAEQKGLHLAFEADPAALPAVQDRTCLHRVVTNLVGNAIKFTERGEVVVTVAPREDRFCLTVRDTGIGIAPAFVPHLFDEFRQESMGMARSHNGSGLGLAITRRLVGMMGGEIHVESEKGRGATFTVIAPLTAPGVRAARTDDTARFPSRPSSSSPMKTPGRSA